MEVHLNSGNYCKIVKYNENCKKLITSPHTHLKYSVQISNLKDFLFTLAALLSRYLFKVLAFFISPDSEHFQTPECVSVSEGKAGRIRAALGFEIAVLSKALHDQSQPLS